VDTSYWSKVLRSRVSRRRALAATGGTALSAAFLAACGGGGDDDEPALDETGLVTLPSDETSRASRGGIMPYNHGDLEFNIDPALAPSFTSSGMIAPVYSTWLKFGKKLSPDRPTAADITGDGMESWEVSEDGLQVTFKLRPDQKFDPRPPTNGRVVTTEDVKWSWDRTEALSPLGGAVFRSAGPSGPVESVEAVDDETVVMRLAEPYGAITELMAYLYIYIAPIEGEDQIDLRSESRGSGPFRMERWDEGIIAEFRRNDDWYDDERPFLDGIDKLFLGEQAAIDAQFVAAQLWETDVDTLPSDILQFKDDQPHLLMKQIVPRLGPGGYPMNVGTALASDERLRRAASMVIDRDSLIQAIYGTSVWTDRGLEVPLIWDGHLSSNAATYLDPKGDELGEGAAYFQYNPEEAKKMMDAAGYDGTELVFVRRASFGPPNLADVISEMIRSGGWNIRDEAVEANDWRQMKLDGPSVAGYDGFFWHTANSFNDDGYLATKYTPSGRDRATDDAIPGITDKVLALRQEFDQERKVELIHEVQRDLAMYMPDVPIVSTQPTLGFQLFQPWLRNTQWVVPGFSGVTSSARPYIEYFIDQEKMEEFG